jgi:hypothetical protein
MNWTPLIALGVLIFAFGILVVLGCLHTSARADEEAERMERDLRGKRSLGA